MTTFSLRTSRAANGVSRRHGAVAREMWRACGPSVPWRRCRSRTSPMACTRRPGSRPDARVARSPPRRRLAAAGEGCRDVGDARAMPDAELWRSAVSSARSWWSSSSNDARSIGRREPSECVDAAASRAFDPNVFTIGFARRIATYKRIVLLTHHPGCTFALLAEAPTVQFVLAGKAHPKRTRPNTLSGDRFATKINPNVAEHVVYLEDYDLRMAARIVRASTCGSTCRVHRWKRAAPAA